MTSNYETMTIPERESALYFPYFPHFTDLKDELDMITMRLLEQSLGKDVHRHQLVPILVSLKKKELSLFWAEKRKLNQALSSVNRTTSLGLPHVPELSQIKKMKILPALAFNDSPLVRERMHLLPQVVNTRENVFVWKNERNFTKTHKNVIITLIQEVTFIQGSYINPARRVPKSVLKTD